MKHISQHQIQATQYTASDQKLEAGKAWERGYRLHTSYLYSNQGRQKQCEDGQAYSHMEHVTTYL